MEFHSLRQRVEKRYIKMAQQVKTNLILNVEITILKLPCTVHKLKFLKVWFQVNLRIHRYRGLIDNRGIIIVTILHSNCLLYKLVLVITHQNEIKV